MFSTMRYSKILWHTLPLIMLLIGSASVLISCDKEENEPAPVPEQESVSALRLLDFNHEIDTEKGEYGNPMSLKLDIEYTEESGILTINFDHIYVHEGFDPVFTKITGENGVIAIMLGLRKDSMVECYAPERNYKWRIKVNSKDFSKLVFHHPMTYTWTSDFKFCPYSYSWLSYDIDLTSDFHTVYEPHYYP